MKSLLYTLLFSLSPSLSPSLSFPATYILKQCMCPLVSQINLMGCERIRKAHCTLVGGKLPFNTRNIKLRAATHMSRCNSNNNNIRICCLSLCSPWFNTHTYIHIQMPLPSSIADIAQKSVVLFLAGTTGIYTKYFIVVDFTRLNFDMAVYYMVNVGCLVNRRMELKKQGKLEEELVRRIGWSKMCVCSPYDDRRV